MHRRGYCICVTVDCAFCPDDTPVRHAAHKPHRNASVEKVHIAVDTQRVEPHIAVTAEAAGGKGK
jgi:hypothetical protein